MWLFLELYFYESLLLSATRFTAAKPKSTVVYGMADGERSPLLSDSRDGMNGLSPGDETYRPPSKPQSESNLTRIDREFEAIYLHSIMGHPRRVRMYDAFRALTRWPARLLLFITFVLIYLEHSVCISWPCDLIRCNLQILSTPEID